MNGFELEQEKPAATGLAQQYGTLDASCEDCMVLMSRYPDGHFDLAVCDPPYGIGADGGIGKYGKLKQAGNANKWDSETPSPEYFTELFRVSKRQIIWGGNYFSLNPSRQWIIWDKGSGFAGRDFAEAEMAWCSWDGLVRIYRRDPLACRDYDNKIHPTQKPVALYRWLLQNYAKPGQRVLDTHLGSGSIAIASHYFGTHLTACEIDADYFNAAMDRIRKETRQLTFENA